MLPQRVETPQARLWQTGGRLTGGTAALSREVPQATRIGQVALTVASVDDALAFYRDALGLPFLFRPGPNLAFLDAGGLRVMLATPQGYGAVGANSIVYFVVEGLRHHYDVFVARGARHDRRPRLAARMPDHDLWVAFLRDPDGNLIGLMEQVRSE